LEADVEIIELPESPAAPTIDGPKHVPSGIREWIPIDDGEPSFDLFDQRPDSGKPVEIPREDGSILVLDSE
jgi:hypothetical protein